MKRLLKFFGFALIGIIVLLAGAILAAPYLLSSDMVKGRIEAVVQEKTGRQLAIDGPSSISLFPNIAVSMKDITLSNPPGIDGAPLVKMKELRANLKLAPLFSGRAEVDSLTFEEPRFELLVTSEGQQNWTFEAESPNTRAAPAPRKAEPGMAKLGFGTILIKSGVLRYRDKQSGREETLEVRDLTLKQLASDGGESGEQAVMASAELGWKQQVFTVSGRIEQLNRLMNKQSSKVALEIRSKLLNGTYDGLLIPAPELALEGNLKADSPSLRQLAMLADAALPEGDGFGPFSFDGKIKGKTSELAFEQSKLTLDSSKLTLDGGLKLGEPRPALSARLSADQLDLNPYLGSGETKQDSAESEDTPLDFSGLKAMDANVTLTAGKILVRKAELLNARIAVKLADGRLDTQIEQLELYRGAATGSLQLDGGSDKAALKSKLALRQILTGAVLRDFAGFDKLAGRGDVDVDLKGSGRTKNQLLASLTGDARFALSDGRIEGFDLGKFVGNFSPSDLPEGFSRPGLRSSGKPATAYDELSGDFRIAEGYARNSNFLMRGRFFRVRASGWANIVKKTLDFRIAPKLMSGAWSFTPAIHLSGPWSAPKSSFDALAFLGGGSGLIRSIESVARGGKLQDALQGRGLKNDEEIEAYLAGKKVDASDAAKAGDSGDEGSSEAPLGGLLKNKDLGKTLNKLFQQ